MFDFDGLPAPDPGAPKVPTSGAPAPEPVAAPESAAPEAVEAPAAPEPEVTLDDALDMIAILQSKLDQMTLTAARERADGMNVKRRANDAVAAAQLYAIEPAAEPLLKTLDTLDLALKNLPEDLGADHRQGLEAVRTQFVRALAAVGISPMDDVDHPLVGAQFDPNFHNAIVSNPGEVEEPTIVVVAANGYMLRDRVLRPALVIVAVPA